MQSFSKHQDKINNLLARRIRSIQRLGVALPALLKESSEQLEKLANTEKDFKTRKEEINQYHEKVLAELKRQNLECREHLVGIFQLLKYIVFAQVIISNCEKRLKEYSAFKNMSSTSAVLVSQKVACLDMKFVAVENFLLKLSPIKKEVAETETVIKEYKDAEVLLKEAVAIFDNVAEELHEEGRVRDKDEEAFPQNLDDISNYSLGQLKKLFSDLRKFRADMLPTQYDALLSAARARLDKSPRSFYTRTLKFNLDRLTHSFYTSVGPISVKHSHLDKEIEESLKDVKAHHQHFLNKFANWDEELKTLRKWDEYEKLEEKLKELEKEYDSFYEELDHHIRDIELRCQEEATLKVHFNQLNMLFKERNEALLEIETKIRGRQAGSQPGRVRDASMQLVLDGQVLIQAKEAKRQDNVERCEKAVEKRVDAYNIVMTAAVEEAKHKSALQMFVPYSPTLFPPPPTTPVTAPVHLRTGHSHRNGAEHHRSHSMAHRNGIRVHS